MRTIEFAGKRADTGNWVYGDYFKSGLTIENHEDFTPNDGWFFLQNKNNQLPKHCIRDERGLVYIILPDTISQYIGKLDISRNKLYENDRVSVKINKILLQGIIIYQKCKFKIHLLGIDYDKKISINSFNIEFIKRIGHSLDYPIDVGY